MRLVLLSLLVAGVAHASPPPPLEILQFPADGRRCSGRRSRAQHGMSTRRSSGNSVGRTAHGPRRRTWRTGNGAALAAQDSESGDVTAALIDLGSGTEARRLEPR